MKGFATEILWDRVHNIIINILNLSWIFQDCIKMSIDQQFQMLNRKRLYQTIRLMYPFYCMLSLQKNPLIAQRAFLHI